MMSNLLLKSRALLLALLVGIICSSNAFATATIVIQNNDAAGVGFNDPTPVAPIGGNSGTTLGQQRLNAFQFAANIWGATLAGGPTITVRATWAALDCTPNSAVLGSAGTTNIFRNFTNAPVANTWYPTALANALSGNDLNGSNAEISARFNLNIGTPGCLENKPWYYGLDNQHGVNRVNLVSVLLHEFGHGLGFASFTDEETGAQAQGIPSIYDRFLLDNTTGKTWPQMTDAERVASAINSGNLVWNGPQVIADAGLLTGGKDSSGRPRLYAPNPVDSGSSVSHWDTVLTPNQLMEPFISTNLTQSVTTPQDLTYSLLKDIGWCTTCPAPQPTPTPGPPPANDNLANAQAISGCSGSVNGTNISATKEAGEPSHNPSTASDADPGGASVWYQWQAPSTGSVTINLVSTAAGSHDTMLAVYTGNSIGSLTSFGKNDDVSSGDTNSRVTFTATAGTTYKIAAAGWNSEQGTFTLSWTQTGCTAAKSDQTITFIPLSGQTYGVSPFALSATASSGLAVSFSIVSGPATISGNTITVTGAGTVTVRASQAGNASFNAAPPVDRSFLVIKATPIISWANPASIVAGTPLSSTQLNATTTVPGTFQYSPAAGTVLGAGTHQLSVTFIPSDTANINNAAASVFLTVVAAPTLLTEEGTSRVVALDSVTLMRGAFPILSFFNFSADHHTRLILFTSNLGSVSVSDLSVQAQGITLPVETVGSVRGLEGQSSYIVVRLVDGLPTGDLSLIMSVRGVPSNTAILSIAP